MSYDAIGHAIDAYKAGSGAVLEPVMRKVPKANVGRMHDAMGRFEDGIKKGKWAEEEIELWRRFGSEVMGLTPESLEQRKFLDWTRGLCDLLEARAVARPPEIARKAPKGEGDRPDGSRTEPRDERRSLARQRRGLDEEHAAELAALHDRQERELEASYDRLHQALLLLPRDGSNKAAEDETWRTNTAERFALYEMHDAQSRTMRSAQRVERAELRTIERGARP